MKLDKLLEGIETSPPVDVKMLSLLEEVQRTHTTKEELMKLVSFANGRHIKDIIQDVNVDVIHFQLASSRQILVATSDFYYI